MKDIGQYFAFLQQKFFKFLIIPLYIYIYTHPILYILREILWKWFQDIG